VELFAIQCTTCRARLKVNDESVIGDILACPKCGSMVQVVPPLGWKRSAEGAPLVEPLISAPQIAPQIAPRTPASTKTKAAAALPPALPRRPAPPQPAPVSNVAIDDTVADSATASAASLPSAASVAPPAIVAPLSPPLASVAQRGAGVWSALVDRAKQDGMLLGGGLLGGIVLGSGIWLVLATQAPSVPIVVDEPGSNPVSLVAKAEATEPAAVPPIENASPPPAESLAQPPGDREAIETAETPAVPASPPAVDAPTAEPAPAPTSVETAPAAADTETRGPTIKLDPAPTAPGDATTREPDRQPTAIQADEVSGEAADAASEPLEAPAADDESAGLARRVLSAEEIDERLSQALPRVDFDKVPLARFVDFIGDFTSLPIVIDDDALAKIGKGRQNPLTLKLVDTTAGEALRAAVSKLGLTCAMREGKVVVTAAGKPRPAK
jgi:hypothetical protein